MRGNVFLLGVRGPSALRLLYQRLAAVAQLVQQLLYKRKLQQARESIGMLFCRDLLLFLFLK